MQLNFPQNNLTKTNKIPTKYVGNQNPARARAHIYKTRMEGWYPGYLKH